MDRPNQVWGSDITSLPMRRMFRYLVAIMGWHIRSRKFKRTTDSDRALNIAPNLLQQDFTASGPSLR